MPPTTENAAPFEVIAAPFEAYIAPIETPFPLVDDAFAEFDLAWKLLGTSGNFNLDDTGVMVAHSQALNLWRALASSGPRKAFRTSEDLTISMVLVDLSLEQYSHIMEANAITTTPGGVGVAGFKKLGLSRGFSVQIKSLLVRGPSPYMDGGIMQYEVPICVQAGDPSLAFVKDKPAGLSLKFQAMEDASAADASERFGRVVAQTDVAST